MKKITSDNRYLGKLLYNKFEEMSLCIEHRTLIKILMPSRVLNN